MSSPLLLYRKLRYGYAFRLIPLTRGEFAKVSPCDYPVMMKHKWYAQRATRGYYAAFSARINGRKRMVFMHNLIMNPPAGLIVDHIDGNGLNNCRGNLRLATNAQNNRNCSAKINGKSRYKGVCPGKGRGWWRATITRDAKQIYLGRFKSEVEAARAYDKAAKKHHGEFARLNFPPRRFDWRRFLRKLRNLPPPNTV